MNDNPYLSIDRQMVGDIYTSPEAMDNLTILCDDFGSRFGGTEGERQAAEFMKAKLEAYGLQNVHLEPVEYLGWRRGEVTLEILSPLQMTLPCITLPHAPAADLEASIVDVGDGSEADFERLGDALKGKIAMVTSRTQPPGHESLGAPQREIWPQLHGRGCRLHLCQSLSRLWPGYRRRGRRRRGADPGHLAGVGGRGIPGACCAARARCASACTVPTPSSKWFRGT